LGADILLDGNLHVAGKTTIGGVVLNLAPQVPSDGLPAEHCCFGKSSAAIAGILSTTSIARRRDLTRGRSVRDPLGSMQDSQFNVHVRKMGGGSELGQETEATSVRLVRENLN